MIDPYILGGYIGTVAAGAIAVWQGRSASKAKTELTETRAAVANAPSTDDLTKVNTELARMNAELAASYRQQGEEWKGLLVKKTEELIEYRKYVHDKNEVDAATMLTLSNENAGLKARTDLSPVLESMQTANKVSQQMLITLGKMSEALDVVIHQTKPAQ